MRMCSVDGCDRKHKAQGLCSTHVSRVYKGHDLDRPVTVRGGFRPCAVAGCLSQSYARGFCVKHYNRQIKHGSPHAVTRVSLRGAPPLDRILDRCRDENGCWIIDGATEKRYGKVKVDGRDVLAHRFTYTYFIADVPDGLQLDHLCRRRSCCNPWHLEPVTPSINVRRGARHGEPTFSVLLDASAGNNVLPTGDIEQDGTTLADEVAAGLHDEPAP